MKDRKEKKRKDKKRKNYRKNIYETLVGYQDSVQRK